MFTSRSYAGLDYNVLHATSGAFCACHECKLHVPAAAVVAAVRNLLADAVEYGESRKETLKALWDQPPRRLDDFVRSCDIH
jgi:hypothetical protein